MRWEQPQSPPVPVGTAGSDFSMFSVANSSLESRISSASGPSLVVSSSENPRSVWVGKAHPVPQAGIISTIPRFLQAHPGLGLISPILLQLPTTFTASRTPFPTMNPAENSQPSSKTQTLQKRLHHHQENQNSSPKNSSDPAANSRNPSALYGNLHCFSQP